MWKLEWDRKRDVLRDAINRRGSLTTAEASALVGEDRSVTRYLLNTLVHAGVARAQGRTRARRYVRSDEPAA